jgi:hypothetical protein
MRANGTLVRGHEIPTVSNILYAVNEWAKEHVTQEKIAEAALVAGTLVAGSFFVNVLHQALQNHTLVGF